MNITFYGATREVTGSMHMVSMGNIRVLLDCGMFQGRRKESEAKNRIFPIDPRAITNLILSHAHIDHSGRIPVLTKDKFAGRVICTRATADVAKALLLDSAHIQESDAQYLNYKTVRSYLNQTSPQRNSKKNSKKKSNNNMSRPDQQKIKSLLKNGNFRLKTNEINALIKKYNLDQVLPIYTMSDAEDALTYFEGYPYQSPITVGKDMSVTFYDAGHILGSAISIIKAKENGRDFTIGFTGDLGRFDRPIIEDPTTEFAEEDRNLDMLIMESTYGDRSHGPTDDLKNRLRDTILTTYNRGGTVLIPAFAFGRTQEIIYVLHELYNEGAVPKIPVYVDSPLAIKITQVFGEHPEIYDDETHNDFLEKGENPFAFKQIKYVGSVEESMALMREKTPHIVVASSGMLEAGRILHHLRNKIHDPKSTILIVGYMAKHTLGRRILELGQEYAESGRNGNAPDVKILGKQYPLKAEVVKLDGFSAHGDKEELLQFLKKSNLNVKRIAVVHGEEEQSVAFTKLLNNEGFSAFAPYAGETVTVD